MLLRRIGFGSRFKSKRRHDEYCTIDLVSSQGKKKDLEPDNKYRSTIVAG
jgi:hypothetical protein